MRLMMLAVALTLAGPAGAETLIVGNKGEDSASFIDLKTGKQRAKVATGHLPHEIAISPDGKTAAIVNYGGTAIDLLDIAAAKQLRRIDLSPNAAPHGLVWLPDGRLIATAEKSRSVAIVSPDGSVSSIATEQAGSHMIAVSADARRAYVTNMQAGSVSVLDLATGTKLQDIAVGGTPEGLALTTDGKELWVADRDAGRVRIISLADLRILGDVPTGAVPIRVAASPDGRFIVTSNFGDGSLSVIDARTRKPVRTIAVSGSKDAAQVTILFSRDGRRLYVAETGPDRIAEVDFASGRVLRRLKAGSDGDGLAIAP